MYRKSFRKIKIASYRYVYNNSDRYVVMSSAYVNVLEAITKVTPMDKMRVITNMLTFPEIADKSILDRKEKMVLIVSRLDENQKRISLMIKAWMSIKEHHGYKLHIVGTGKDGEYLEKLASSSKDIIFEGAQSPLSWYQSARIFLMASPREGWGLTLTESLQNGVVPIALKTSKVFADIIDDGVTGFLPKNKKEFREKLLLLLKDNELRNKMAVAGLNSANRFSSSVVG